MRSAFFSRTSDASGSDAVLSDDSRMTVPPAEDDSPDEDVGFRLSATVVAPPEDAAPAPFDLTVVDCDCFLPENVSTMLSAAGPSSTMNKVGRMNRIIGTVSMAGRRAMLTVRSEEHTSELQSLAYLVCRL